MESKKKQKPLNTIVNINLKHSFPLVCYQPFIDDSRKSNK